MSTPLIRTALMLSVMLSVAGCSVFASNDDQTKKLEERLEGLKSRYARKTKDIERDTQKKKKDVQRSLKQQDIARTITLLDELYAYTNPCGEDRCTKDRGSSIFGRDYIFEEEDIDREEDFIEDSMDEAIKQAKQALKRKEYGRLEVALVKADKQWAYDSSRQEALVELRDSLQQTWLKDMTKLAQSNSATLPGVALLQYTKAIELANTQGNRQASAALRSKRSALRARLINDNTFDIRLMESNGVLARQVSDIMLGIQRKKLIRVTRAPSPTLDGALNIQTTPPSFKIFDTAASGSFKFSNGTRQVKNEKYDELRDQEKYYVYLANHCGSECGDTGTCAYRTFDNWRGRGGGTRLSHDACSVSSSAHSNAISARSQASSMGPYKTVTNYDQHSYAYTVHSHRAQANLSMLLDIKGERPIKSQALIDATLTDKSHPAVSHRGSGVGADPKQIPSADAVQKKLAQTMALALENVLAKRFDARLGALLEQGDTDGESGRLARVNGMVIHGLITPYKLSKEYRMTLRELSGIPNADALLGAKAP